MQPRLQALQSTRARSSSGFALSCGLEGRGLQSEPEDLNEKAGCGGSAGLCPELLCGFCLLVWSGARPWGLFCLLAGAWDWSHTGPLAGRSRQLLGGCAGDKNSEGPSAAGYSAEEVSAVRGGGGGQGKGRERGEEDWTASPASREQVAEFFLGRPSPARCGLCSVPGCPGR